MNEHTVALSSNHPSTCLIIKRSQIRLKSYRPNLLSPGSSQQLNGSTVRGTAEDPLRPTIGRQTVGGSPVEMMPRIAYELDRLRTGAEGFLGLLAPINFSSYFLGAHLDMMLRETGLTSYPFATAIIGEREMSFR
jgi:hypothetical protein